MVVLGLATSASAQVPGLPPILPPPGGGGEEEPPPATLPPPGSGGQATEPHTNPQGTGYSPNDTLIPPLVRRWTRSLGDEGTATPVIAEGRVFVAASGYDGGARVLALAPSTGKVRWRRVIASQETPLALTYESGLLMVSDGSGAIQALEPAKGQTVWKRQLDVGGLGQPVSDSGIVVVTLGLRVFALNAGDGSVRWEAQVPPAPGGPRPPGAPLIADGRVLAGCANAAWRLTDGDPVWSNEDRDCPGRSIAFDGSLYKVDIDGGILNAETGAPEGTFDGGYPLIFTPFTTIADESRLLKGRTSPRGEYKWTFPQGECGGSTCVEAVAAGHDLYLVREDDRMFVVDLVTGKVRWRQKVPTLGGDPGPLAIGQGLVVFTAGERVFAYSSVLDPPANGLVDATFDAYLAYRDGTEIFGALGAGLRAAGRQSVTLMGDTFPFRGMKRLATTTSAGDGGYSFRVRPKLNTRYRTRAGRRRSRGGTVIVFPRIRDRILRGRGRRINDLRAHVKLTGPPRVRLAGRRVYLYLVRVRKRRVERQGGSRLRRAGKGRGRAVIRFKALRGLRKGDFLYYCIPHLARSGLGIPGVVDRRCGARRLPF